MAVIKDDKEQIISMMRTGDYTIRREFRAEVQSIQSEMTDDQLDRVGRGEELPEQATDSHKTAAAVLALLLLAGRKTTATIEAQQTQRLSFDAGSTDVMALIQSSRDRIAQIYRDGQITATRAAVTDAISRNVGPDAMREAIRQSVGLTERQVKALIRYRELLKRVGTGDNAARAVQSFVPSHASAREIAAAIRNSAPLDDATIRRMVEAYREAQLRVRSKTIGQTESGAAVNQGVQEAWDQAVEAGAVPPGKIGRSSRGGYSDGGNSIGQTVETWETMEDERVRESHVHLQGMARPESGFWQGALGPLRFPHDPLAPLGEIIGCRCFLYHETSD